MKKLLVLLSLGFLTVGCVEIAEPKCEDCFSVVGYVLGPVAPVLSHQTVTHDLTIITENKCTGEIQMHTRRLRARNQAEVEKSYPKFSCWTGW